MTVTLRVIRGIVLARRANFIEGHAGVTPELVTAVAGRIDGRRLPPVPRYGNGGPGEIQALGWLFGDIPAQLALGVKEGMSLINGAPCAPALLADATLSTSRALEVAESVFGLATAAMVASLLVKVLRACPPIERRRSLGPDLERLSTVLAPSIPD